MGLGIVKALTVALKGNVEFKSNEGVGSIFTFSIRASYHKNSVQNLCDCTSLASPLTFKRELPNIQLESIISPFILCGNTTERQGQGSPTIPLFLTKHQIHGFGKLSTQPVIVHLSLSLSIYIYIYRYIYIYMGI